MKKNPDSSAQAAVEPTLSRRSTLRWIAATSLASALSGSVQAAAQTLPATALTDGASNVTAGYGLDPNLLHPVVPWPRTMTAEQLQRAAVLADIILPGTATAPAPSALGVADFIDEWVSAPYPDQRNDRALIIEGLGALDINKLDPKSAFFKRFRFLVVTAYYTTPEGFKDIGYTGNVPMKSYPPITEEERAILDTALAKLGIRPSSVEKHS